MKSSSLYKALCRITKYGSFNQTEFNRVSCMNCYRLLTFVVNGFHEKILVTNDGYFYVDNHLLDPTDKDHIQKISEYMDNVEFGRWRLCCDEAASCCDKMSSFSNYLDSKV